MFDIPPSYNIAPTTFQPVIRLDRDTGEREITTMRWGLIPAWCKDVKLLGLSVVVPFGIHKPEPVPGEAVNLRYGKA